MQTQKGAVCVMKLWSVVKKKTGIQTTRSESLSTQTSISEVLSSIKNTDFVNVPNKDSGS